MDIDLSNLKRFRSLAKIICAPILIWPLWKLLSELNYKYPRNPDDRAKIALTLSIFGQMTSNHSHLKGRGYICMMVISNLPETQILCPKYLSELKKLRFLNTALHLFLTQNLFGRSHIISSIRFKKQKTLIYWVCSAVSAPFSKLPSFHESKLYLNVEV